MGFEHHKVTPKHARANGEAESFMKKLNKTEQGRDRTVAIQEMLMGYRSTPHPATKTAPYAAIMNRQVRTTLDHTNPKEEEEKTRDTDRWMRKTKSIQRETENAEGKQEHKRTN